LKQEAALPGEWAAQLFFSIAIIPAKNFETLLHKQTCSSAAAQALMASPLTAA
jgi:hypothetical protein